MTTRNLGQQVAVLFMFALYS